MLTDRWLILTFVAFLVAALAGVFLMLDNAASTSSSPTTIVFTPPASSSTSLSTTPSSVSQTAPTSTTVSLQPLLITGVSSPTMYPLSIQIEGSTEPFDTLTFSTGSLSDSLKVDDSGLFSFVFDTSTAPTETIEIVVASAASGQALQFPVQNILPMLALDDHPATVSKPQLDIAGLAVPGATVNVDSPFGTASTVATVSGRFEVTVFLTDPPLDSPVILVVTTSSGGSLLTSVSFIPTP